MLPPATSAPSTRALRTMLEHLACGCHRFAARAAIEAWLAEHRRLALGRRRWHVHPTREQSTFAGYRVTRGGVTMGETMVRHMRLKVQAAASRGMLALSRTLVSYQGLARFG